MHKALFRILLVVTVAAGLNGCVSIPDTALTTVETRAGAVKGSIEKDVVKYLGVPYAKPPVGALRWMNPVPADSWTGVKDATRYGKACAQVKELGDFASASVDEDCLYLNVFTPKSAKKRAVMVWFHGGASTGMSNGYDGSALAREQGVVVVTVNYRLGALGALVHPALDSGGATTQYGLRDEQFALHWVKDNIAGFGGDPENVTIFGESTGATDVLFHIISPEAKGLFHRAIVQSPARYFKPIIALATAEERGKQFAKAVGCDDQSASCLRKVPVQQILTAQGSFAGSCCETLPVQDGHILTKSIQDAIRSGQFNRVPIFAVTARDEDRWFQAFFGELSNSPAIRAEEYPAKIAAQYGDDANAVLAAYPLSEFDSPAGGLAAASGDFSAICQPRSFNIDASKFVSVYAAEFGDRKSPGILPPTSFPLLASHTHEIQYIFPGWKGVYEGRVTSLTAEQQELAREMRNLWASFAEKGALPAPFPPISRTNQRVISLETPRIRLIDDFAKTHRCELWNSIRKWAPLE